MEGSGAVFRSLFVIVHGLYIELIVLRQIYLTDSVYYHLVDLIRLPKAPCSWCLGCREARKVGGPCVVDFVLQVRKVIE